MNAEKSKFEYAVPLAERISVQEITHAAGESCPGGYQASGCMIGDTTSEEEVPE